MALHNDSTTHKGKNLQIHNMKVSSTTVWRYVTNKGWKALKRKCRGAHADMVPEGFANFISKDNRPANSCDFNPLEIDHLDYP